MDVLLMIGADFPHFALILAHDWRLLPPDSSEDSAKLPGQLPKCWW